MLNNKTRYTVLLVVLWTCSIAQDKQLFVITELMEEKN